MKKPWLEGIEVIDVNTGRASPGEDGSRHWR